MLEAGGESKIDAAYAIGGPVAAIATVERNFHVHIDEYAWVGLTGLIKLIDLLGGVDVFVTNPVLDDAYPDDINGGFLYGYKTVAVLPGAQHLDGAHALQYVRSRHNDINGDFGRSARQQEVLLAMKVKASTLNAADLPDIVSQQVEHFFTHYKDLEPDKWVRIGRWGDAEEAKRVLLEAIERAKAKAAQAR